MLKSASLRVLTLVVLGSFLVIILNLYSPFKQPTYNSRPLPIKIAVNTPKPQQAPAYLPVRIKIPRINVNSAIEYLGLTATGEMATTKNPSTVAWYDLGPRPGDIGSAVIAGHFGWKDNIPAAFDHLAKLQIGDKVYIVDTNGETITFAVQAIKTFDKTDDAKSVFSSSDGKSHLNLITCEGAWSNTTHSYSNRLVIFSDKQ